MKIAILGYVFSGATLPLAKQLYNTNNDVDCFYLVNIGTQSVESIDFDKKVKGLGTITKLGLSNKLYNYLPNKVGVYICPVLEKRRSFVRLHIGGLIERINTFFLDKYIDYIIEQSYDVVNVVIQTKFEFYIAKKLLLAGVHCVLSFHEVLQTLVGNPVLKKVVREAMKLKVPIILHSEKTKNDLYSFYKSDNINNLINVVPFGTFDSYTSHGEGRRIDDIDFPFYLFLGALHPYKGLKYLCEAFQKVRTNCKVVIAGKGYDSCLKTISGDKRFVVINRFIANEELVWLIRNCKAVICPYIAASQSGLVQTAFAFNKALIATKVGAFVEIIKSGHNGYLANPADAIALEKAINLFENYGVDTSCMVPDKYRWDTIVKEYLRIFQTL